VEVMRCDECGGGGELVVLLDKLQSSVRAHYQCNKATNNQNGSKGEERLMRDKG